MHSAKLIRVLKRVVADFKTVQLKFEKQNVPVSDIKEYFDAFKKLRDKNYIKNNQEKDIDYWGKQSWENFKSFVDELKTQKSKSSEMKDTKQKGVELVAENDDWKIYKMFTHQAVLKYGSGTQWCITEEDGVRWREYRKHSSFYFMIAKKLDRENPFYKIAVQVPHNGNHTVYWDSRDDSHNKLPDLNVPKYDFIPFENNRELDSLIESLKKEGVTDDTSSELLETFGHRPIKYFPEKEFLAFEEYSNLGDYALSNDNTLLWNVEILNGEQFLDDATASIDHYEVEKLLDEIQKKYPEMYDNFLGKLLTEESFKEYMEEEYTFEEGTDIKTLKENKDLNRRISFYIEDDNLNDELHNAFEYAANDACRSATEGALWRSIDRNVKNTQYVHLEGEYLLDSKCYIGTPISNLKYFDSDIVTEINEEIDIGIKKFDYEYPDTNEILDHLVEHHLTEYIG
jgi:hypothetical protein